MAHVCLRSAINKAQNVAVKCARLLSTPSSLCHCYRLRAPTLVSMSAVHIIFLVVSCLFVKSIKIW